MHVRKWATADRICQCFGAPGGAKNTQESFHMPIRVDLGGRGYETPDKTTDSRGLGSIATVASDARGPRESFRPTAWPSVASSTRVDVVCATSLSLGHDVGFERDAVSPTRRRKKWQENGRAMPAKTGRT